MIREKIKDISLSILDSDSTSIIVESIYILLIISFVSAVWFESDAYRYAGTALSIIGLIHYFSSPRRPAFGIMAQICVAWACYVGLRMAYTLVFFPGLGSGTAEGIYLLPLLYCAVGYAFATFSIRPFLLAQVFVVVSCLVAAISLDVASLGSGQRAWSEFHNNPIHAAVGMGIIVLCVLPFACEAAQSKRWVLATVAIVTFVLGVTNVFGLQSKGVWLSLGAALPIQALIFHWSSQDRMTLYVAVGSVVGCIVLVGLLGEGMWSVAETTVRAIVKLALDIGTGGGVMDSVARAITDLDTPQSLRERLMLWASAVEIWSRAPWFGLGIGWLHHWQERAYEGTGFNILHNGYLEIAIRYGVTGLIFYFTLFIWAAICVWRACRRGVISQAALQSYIPLVVFFAITIVTNSNVRLAIGESFMWCAASFAFYCYFLMQRVGSDGRSGR